MSPSSVPPPSAPPPVDAVPAAPCEACGQAFDARAASCPRCGFPRGGATSQLGRPAAAKSPRTAMWLSLAWPGAGHLYAGDSQTGAIFAAVSAVCALLALVVGPALTLLLWLGLALYTAIDAGRAAR